MNETVLTIEEAAGRLAAVVERVRVSGEAALLVKSGLPVARIIPIMAAGRSTEDLISFLRRWRSEHPEADEQFAEAVADSRKVVRSPHDPWE